MNKKVIIGIALAFLLLAAIGFTYAYFSGGVSGNEEAENQIVETGTLSLNYTDGPEITLNNAYPGDKIEKTFTVENTGSLDTSYIIYLNNLINNFTNDELVISFICTSYKSGEEYGTCSGIENQIIPYSETASKTTIKANIPVESGVTHEYKLEIIFKELNSVQNYNQGKTFSGVINIEYTYEDKCALNTYEEGTIAHKMLSDNCAYPDNTSSPYVTSASGINFGDISSDTNGKGLYYTSNLTKTEDLNGDGIGERVYYYRGAVENNYLIFAGHCWRIIRTNENGSVKLRYQGDAINNEGIYTCSTTATPVTTMAFNNLSDDVAYSGYMYPDTPTTSSILEMDNDTLNKNESDMKVYLDDWYDDNLASYESNIADTIYCADRTISDGINYYNYINTKNPYGKNTVFYGGVERLIAETNDSTWISRKDASPQYLCERNEDSFTKDETLGNGKLEKAIGLITIDEAAYAGGLFVNTDGSSSNDSYYLYTGLRYWTMSPERYYSGSVMFNISLNGEFGASFMNYTECGVFPAISLKSDVEVTGTGTYDNPYVVENQ